MFGRRIYLFSLFFISFIIFNNSFSQELNLKKLSENLYAVFGGGGNCTFFVTEEGALLVDSKTSPSLGKELLKKIREVTDKEIKYLVYTHYHGDHIQGAQVFEGAKVVSHINTKKKITQIAIPRMEEMKLKILPEQIKSAKEKLEKLKAENSPEIKKAEDELSSLERRLKDIESLKIILPDITIDTKEVIRLGGKEIVLFYSGRGHTDGDLIIYFPSEKVIHMGDLVFNNIIPYIDYQGGSSTENWIKILEDVEKEDVRTVIPGHGEIGDKGILKAQRQYLVDLREEVKKYFDKGLTLEEVIKRADLPKYKDLEGYKQRFSRNVEAVFREFMGKNSQKI